MARKKKDKYSIKIFWSEKDRAFIGIAEELEGCSAFRDTKIGNNKFSKLMAS